VTSLLLIPWADTDWSAAGRIAASTPIGLNDTGVKRARQWACQVANRELAAVYRSKEEASVQTADIVAKCTEARVKCVPELREVDVGLWEGLTMGQIKERFPKIFKRWNDQPDSVSPPEGEDLQTAGQRLERALHKIASKQKDRAVGVVLGPTALALARCQMEHRNRSDLRQLITDEPVWYQVGSEAHRPTSEK
jgi:broad specificity phosphatase PhoE